MQKIDNLNSHLQDIDEDALNIRYDLSKAGSQLTVAYLENGSLLRSSNNYGS